MCNPRIGVLISLAALLASLSVFSFADSQVRIVRLSYVEGGVQIERSGSQGFQKAFLNLPVIQGATLCAGHDGFAEVEFEDGSTVRITPGAMIAFPQLTLRDSGAQASTVRVLQGTAYVAVAGKKDNEFTLAFGPESLALNAPVHLRLGVSLTKATLAVFKGELQVKSPSGINEVSGKESVTFDLAAQDQLTLAKKVADNPYDSWDQQQTAYYQRYAKNSLASASLPYNYGSADLNYYGSYSMVPGYGMLWQPFFASASWDPFMNGAWGYDPSFGYSWVSAYPWGWLPYHYGSWNYISGYGWGWQPGGTWTGLNNTPAPVNAPAGFVPPRPPTVPVRGLVVVNRGPAPAVFTTAGSLMVRNNSAGLGIYRGSIANLGRISSRAEQRGYATVTPSAVPSAAMTASMGSSGFGSSSSSAVGPSGASSSPASRGGFSAPSAGISGSHVGGGRK